MRTAARAGAVAAVAATLILSACTTSTGGHPTAASSAPSPTAAGSGQPTPATPSIGLIRFVDCTSAIKKAIGHHGGSSRPLQFGCGRMRVPLDYRHPDGATVTLTVVRAHYERQHDRIGSLIINPGGPGGSGLDAAVGSSLSLPINILQRFDIVGFDPRGIGASGALHCIPAALKDKTVAADPDARTAAQFAAQIRLAKEIAEGCRAAYGAKLPLYDTEETARDLDLVRQAVGDSRLNYLGYSYGTLLGAVYAQLFPHRIRAMVLDGAVDPRQSDVSAAESQARSFEAAFDQYAADCRAHDCPIAPHPRQFVTGLLADARRHPIPTSKGGDPRRATAGNVELAVASALYSQSDWPKLSKALYAAAHGDSRKVLALDDQYTERMGNGHYSNLLDANVVINCGDTSPRATVATARAKLPVWRAKYPLFGAGQAIGLLGCAEWEEPANRYPTVHPAGAPPILVVGTLHDPATPYAAAQALTGQLGSGVLLSWNGEGHTAYPQTACVRRHVDAYLIDLTLPPRGTVCPRT
jgi:pimeloyl-ACP methyl ester carboxylesterase